MNRYVKIVSYIVIFPILFSVGFVKADYYQQLKKIEELRLDDLAATKSALKEISEKESDFSDEERHLYILLNGHSKAMYSEFPESEALLMSLVESSAGPDYKGRAHSILAAVEHIQGDYVSSFYHLDKSLEFIPKMGNQKYKENLLQNALSFYNDSGMLGYAMEYARRLLKFGVDNNDFSNQCRAYFEMISIEISAEKIQMAESRLGKTYSICKKSNDRLSLLHLPKLEAEIAMTKGLYEKAKNLLEENYEEIKEYKWKISIADTEVNLASIYLNLGDYKKAEDFAIKALEASKKIKDVKRTKKAVEVLARLHSKQGDKDKAIKYYKDYMELEKKMETISKQRKLAHDSARRVLEKEQFVKLEKAN